MSDYYSNYNYVSQSMLKVFLESPELYYRRFILPADHVDHIAAKPPTDAMILGSLTHAVLLEQDALADVHVIDATTRSTNLWKAEAANAAEWGKTPVLKSTFDVATKIAESARSNKHVKAFLESIPDDAVEERELEFFWQGQYLPKKAKLDQLFLWAKNGVGHCAIVELKTTSDPSADAFLRQYYDMNYHVQAAWYEEAVRVSLEHASMNFTHHVIAARNKEPYDVAFYNIVPGFVSLGQKKIMAFEPLLARSINDGLWTLNEVQDIKELHPLHWMK